MGTWGTAISSNDTYADVFADFFKLYNEGLDPVEISLRLIEDHQETIQDEDDCHNFWFALAKAQWECKQLDHEILTRVRAIVETGSDIEVWRRLGADEKDLKKRKGALDKFLSDLQVERSKPKPRKKISIRQPVFEKGDCLAYRLENGNYGGAVVLEAIKDSEYGYNLIAATRINQPNKPTKQDFERAEVLLLNYASWDNSPVVNWYHPIRHKQVAHLIGKVDTIDVQVDFDIDKPIHGFVGDFDIWFIEVADKQFQSEKTKPRPSSKQTIKELTRKKSWKLW